MNIQFDIKTGCDNYPLWSAQVLPAICAAQLDERLTGDDQQPDKDVTVMVDDKPIKKRNPAYTTWMAQDQAILGYLLSMLTRKTLMRISHCTSSAHAWRTLADLYSSQSHARSVNTWIALATTKSFNCRCPTTMARCANMPMSLLQ
jgi:hypothetical protein